jgi:hypothetical protein
MPMILKLNLLAFYAAVAFVGAVLLGAIRL